MSATSSPRFRDPAPKGKNKVKARVIGVVENQAPTKALTRELEVATARPDGQKRDVGQIALVREAPGDREVVNGFVSGFGYKEEMRHRRDRGA